MYSYQDYTTIYINDKNVANIMKNKGNFYVTDLYLNN